MTLARVLTNEKGTIRNPISLMLFISGPKSEPPPNIQRYDPCDLALPN